MGLPTLILIPSLQTSVKVISPPKGSDTIALVVLTLAAITIKTANTKMTKSMSL